MVRSDGFSDDFVWGCSTSSYQVEGAVDEDGRGVSIWDTFSHTKGKIRDGSNGDVACDSYHRFEDDRKLLERLGVNAYRFSIAWPRIQPNGKGSTNQKGIDHYSRLIDGLLEKGIEPWPTLYHWDLPQALEDAGGWPERDTAYRFAEYAAAMFRAFGSRVHHWTSVNEPWCSAFLGYRDGEHAPGLHDVRLAHRAVHHLLLAHGLSNQLFRQTGMEGEFGIVINPVCRRPAQATEAHRQAAMRASLEQTNLWLDPVFGRGYPQEYVQAYGAQMPVLDGDLELIATPVDFVGVNYYEENCVEPCPQGPENPLGYRIVPTTLPKTAMGWDVVPDGLRRLLVWISNEWKPKALYVTENGAAFVDTTSQGAGEEGEKGEATRERGSQSAARQERIHDTERIAYLRDHIGACRQAIAEGVPLKGYFVWSLLDNFEWAWGYSMKFGLVAVDACTQARLPKDSFDFYRTAITGTKNPRF
ncbi:MAG TPA: family 1 glycosylhydrolase [Spirochaetales bacterium]|nr:family 1 glycosylhydrolase [Spirochaetales bacterium]